VGFSSGVASVGGVIFSPRGTLRLTFSWSLVTITNNQVEAYALLQGLLLARQQGLECISILGDLKVVINHVKKKTMPLDTKLRTIFTRIHKEMEAFNTLVPFHVLRHNNGNANFQANQAIRDKMGTLGVNGHASLQPIP
jgi:ribonuclease HI